MSSSDLRVVDIGAEGDGTLIDSGASDVLVVSTIVVVDVVVRDDIVRDLKGVQDVLV